MIEVDSLAAFQADMESPTFIALVEAFSTMAEVVETVVGERVGLGYGRPGASSDDPC